MIPVGREFERIHQCNVIVSLIALRKRSIKLSVVCLVSFPTRRPGKSPIVYEVSACRVPRVGGLMKIQTRRRTREPSVYSFAAYLRTCTEQAAFDWLKRYRDRSLDFSESFHFPPEGPEWDPVIDKLLFRRKSRIVDAGLAQFGCCEKVLRRMYAGDNHTLKVLVCSNPNTIHLRISRTGRLEDTIGWHVVNCGSLAEKRAYLGNAALSFEFMKSCLSDADITADEIALRLYFISFNPMFRYAASGGSVAEDWSREYIGFPWYELKARIAELIVSLPIQANTAQAVCSVCSHFNAGLDNHVKIPEEEWLNAINRWSNPDAKGVSKWEDEHIGIWQGESVSLSTTRHMIPLAIIPGRRENMLAENDDVFRGFCHWSAP